MIKKNKVKKYKCNSSLLCVQFNYIYRSIKMQRERPERGTASNLSLVHTIKMCVNVSPKESLVAAKCYNNAAAFANSDGFQE